MKQIQVQDAPDYVTEQFLENFKIFYETLQFCDQKTSSPTLLFTSLNSAMLAYFSVISASKQAFQENIDKIIENIQSNRHTYEHDEQV